MFMLYTYMYDFSSTRKNTAMSIMLFLTVRTNQILFICACFKYILTGKRILLLQLIFKLCYLH